MVTGCLQLSDVSIICRVVNPRDGRRRIFREVSCTECTFRGNEFELIPMVKIETRNPVEGYIGSEFPVICNHWRGGGLKSQDIKNFDKFLRF